MLKVHWKKSWEHFDKKSVFFSKLVFLLKRGHSEKNTYFFSAIFHDFYPRGNNCGVLNLLSHMQQLLYVIIFYHIYQLIEYMNSDDDIHFIDPMNKDKTSWEIPQ